MFEILKNRSTDIVNFEQLAQDVYTVKVTDQPY